MGVTLATSTTWAVIKANDIGIPKVATDDSTFATITSLIFVFVGALATLFLIIGAFRYVTSQGDSKQIAAAKGTIIYALIGMVVSGTAFGIVQFLLGRVL